jgi:hypothetical protein
VGPEPSPDFDGDRRGDPGVVEADVLPAAVFQPVPPVLGRRFVALGIRIDVDGPVADLDRGGPDAVGERVDGVATGDFEPRVVPVAGQDPVVD